MTRTLVPADGFSKKTSIEFISDSQFAQTESRCFMRHHCRNRSASIVKTSHDHSFFFIFFCSQSLSFQKAVCHFGVDLLKGVNVPTSLYFVVLQTARKSPHLRSAARKKSGPNFTEHTPGPWPWSTKKTFGPVHWQMYGSGLAFHGCSGRSTYVIHAMIDRYTEHAMIEVPQYRRYDGTATRRNGIKTRSCRNQSFFLVGEK